MPVFKENTGFKMESPLKKSSPNKWGETKRMKLARKFQKENSTERKEAVDQARITGSGY